MVSPLTGFAKYLVDAQILEDTAIAQLSIPAPHNSTTLITKIIKNRLLPPSMLAQMISTYFKIPLIDLTQLLPTQLPLHLLPLELIGKYQVVPLAFTKEQIQLGVADPTDLTPQHAIKAYTKLNITLAIVACDQLTNLITKITTPNQYATPLAKDPQIVKFIEQILADAIAKQASDIHFEPYAKFCRIRFRIDGLLYEITKTARSFLPQFSTRLKIMANLDIAEKRLPQDGRFTLSLPNQKEKDCRLSSCPTIFGEKLVVRILNPINATLDIAHLGLTPAEHDLLYKQLHQPQGLILVTGPTGSGKTLTLYTALNILNHVTKNIATVEDPVEINLVGINQIEVNYKLGLTFVTALRAILRQDPDIIMLGEIRDAESAEIAIKAALTGHLVLATLHTNSATATLTRLLNLGISKFNIATALNLIIAQRLIRKLCPQCKQPSSAAANPFHASPTGCNYCHQGYLGRIAIFEMLPITSSLRELIRNRCNISKITQQVKQLGLPTLHTAALNKVAAGVTTLAEINRVVM